MKDQIIRAGFLLASAIVMANCSSDSKRKEQPVEIKNGDVHISYTKAGTGDTTLLFVHGWCINKTYFEDQAKYFSNRYQVVTMDLPGFGQSGKNRKDWTVEDYGRDVSAVMNGLDLKNVVLVGHSMSGEIIVEAAHDSKGRVIALVGIDNFTSVGLDFSHDKSADSIFTAFRSNFKKNGGDFMRTLFFDVSDSKTRKRVMTDFYNCDSLVAISSLQQNVKYSAKAGERLKSLNMKVNLINSDKSAVDPSGYKKLGIKYEVLTISGTGHFPMIEKPEEFNVLLDSTLAGIAAQ